MKTILLIPHPDCRGRLLADGPCGGRVPVALGNECIDRHGWIWRPRTDLSLWTCPVCGAAGAGEGGDHRALVLAHEGADCTLGLARLDEIASGLGTFSGPDPETPPYPDGSERCRYAWNAAHYASAGGLGEVVVLP